MEEKPMKKVLVTGFAPFGAEAVNPSYEAVKLLPDRILGAAIVKAEIPVVFGQCGQVLAQLMAAEHPDLVLLVGQAGGRSAMEVERVAINCQDCPPDYPDKTKSILAKKQQRRGFSRKKPRRVKSMIDGKAIFGFSRSRRQMVRRESPIPPAPTSAMISCTGFCTCWPRRIPA